MNNSDSKKKYKFGYIILVMFITFLVHKVLSSLVKKALKMAILSETIGITLALAVVSAIMLILYFAGRKIILKKEIMPIKLYCFISAHLPFVIWLIIMIYRSVTTFSDFEYELLSEFNIKNILDVLKSFIGIINAVISFISSFLVLFSSCICELFSWIAGFKAREAKK